MDPQLTEPRISAVSLALLDRGRVLLVKRGRAPAKGLFAFPGGRVEAGETLEQAVRRELHEETGLAAGAVSLLTTIDIEPETPGQKGFALNVFAGTQPAGRLTPGDDAADAGWYSLDEIAALPITASTAEIARQLLAEAGGEDSPS